MFSFKVAVTLAVLAMLVVAAHCESAFEGSCGRQLSPSELTRLYNSKVYLAERVERPFVGFLPHAGVRVTLETRLFDEGKWLVHMGKAYGNYNTVVVRASCMSSKWKTKKTKNFRGSKTVADFVKAGGTNYNIVTNNCLHAAKRMMAV